MKALPDIRLLEPISVGQRKPEHIRLKQRLRIQNTKTNKSVCVGCDETVKPNIVFCKDCIDALAWAQQKLKPKSLSERMFVQHRRRGIKKKM